MKSVSVTLGLYSSLSWRLLFEGAGEEWGSVFVKFWLVKCKLAGAFGGRAYGDGVIERVLQLPLDRYLKRCMCLICVGAGVTVRGGRSFVGHFDSYIEETGFLVL